ncbi:tRNA (adenine(22)-N(1))-methyltransferase TrmK, partial [Deinococcus sp.]|uniref:tRNA (adenine(22)-N(1))-methyltransferase TrmK n=1 Tax=Deinococcus sp. TaxID=47478 RepID=UPI0025B9F5D6
MPPTLDARLDAVLRLIRAESHADIGSDHAYLPLELVRSGRVRRVVVVEVNAAPFARAQQNVARAGLGAQIDVRLGNGFAPLAPGEVQSASLTGMGATTVLGVMQRA